MYNYKYSKKQYTNKKKAREANIKEALKKIKNLEKEQNNISIY